MGEVAAASTLSEARDAMAALSPVTSPRLLPWTLDHSEGRCGQSDDRELGVGLGSLHPVQPARGQGEG